MRNLLTVLIALIVCSCGGNEKPETTQTSSKVNTEFQNGDIIFQTSQSSQSKAIQLATHSV